MLAQVKPDILLSYLEFQNRDTLWSALLFQTGLYS